MKPKEQLQGKIDDLTELGGEHSYLNGTDAIRVLYGISNILDDCVVIKKSDVPDGFVDRLKELEGYSMADMSDICKLVAEQMED